MLELTSVWHSASSHTLQVIEAHYLYGASYDNIEIVIHPQSIIHSMVETQDSSVLAQVQSAALACSSELRVKPPAAAGY